MRRRLVALFVLASAAAGCSLLVEFDRENIPALVDPDGAADVTSPPDARLDVSTVDGDVDGSSDSSLDALSDASDAGDAGDAAVDAPADAPADAAVDAPADAAVDAPADVVDASDANVVDANDAGPDADDGATDAGADADDGAVDAAADVAADAADAAFVSAKCTQVELDANDLTAQSAVTISFPTDATPAQYTPNCIKITAGTVVTFSGNFSNHPLTNAGGGGPIVNTAVGTDGGDVGDVPFTFTTAGSYDFQCGVHGAQMFGAIQVVP